MNVLRKLKSAGPDAAVLAVFLVCVLVVALIYFNPGFTRYSSAVYPFFILQPDDVQEESIPNYAGVRRTYTFTIPETNTATTTGARLMVYLRHTIARYDIEGSDLHNDLAENETPHIGQTPGNYWISIPMRPIYGGKTVRIVLTPVYDSVRDVEPTFMVITKDTLLTMMELPKDRLILSLGLLSAIAGLFLMLMVFAMPLPMAEKRRLFYLGSVTVTAGLWKLCGLPSIPLLFEYWGQQKVLWYIGAVSYLLMMILSLRLLTVMNGRQENPLGKSCFFASAAIFSAKVKSFASIAELNIFSFNSLYSFTMPN